MASLWRFCRSINALLIFIPISLALVLLSPTQSLLIFVVSALAIVPIAGLMGKATEELSKHLGPTWGGLLNATFGNATELIIGLFALHAGLINLVRASIIGSILSNILLVLGASILAGGIKYKVQVFNQDQAESHAINLLLASLSLAVPAIIAMSYGQTNSGLNPNVENLSLWVSGILLAVYIASLVFSLKTHEKIFRGCETEEDDPIIWRKRMALTVLGIATVLVAIESEFLVKSVEGAAKSMGVNDVFIGIVIVAIIGNAAEHATAVWMAMKNKMDIAINIAIGSSTQIAMFVAPVLVFASLLFNYPLTFIFNVPELAAIGFSVVIAAFIASDGKCHWLEGAQLLAAYAIIALSFFFLPS